MFQGYQFCLRYTEYINAVVIIIVSCPVAPPLRRRRRASCACQGAGRDAFEAVYESEDPLGNHGVRLSKEIVKVAGRAMEKNFTSLGPYVLPISEQYKVVKALALRKVLSR